MNEAKEITVKIRGEEKTLKRKFLVYEDCFISIHDPVINDLIRELKREFHGEIDSIKVSINLLVL